MFPASSRTGTTRDTSGGRMGDSMSWAVGEKLQGYPDVGRSDHPAFRVGSWCRPARIPIRLGRPRWSACRGIAGLLTCRTPMTRLVSLAVLMGLVALFGLLSFRVMASFLLPMLLAAMLVVIFSPLHRWVRERTRWPDWAAAAVTTVAVVLIVLTPIALVLFRAGGDAVAILRRPEGIRLDPHVLDGLVARFNELTGLQITAESVNGELKRLIEEWIGPIAARAPAVIAKILIGAIVTVVSLFYFLADGGRMIEGVTRLIPLDRRYQWQLLQEFEEVSRAVVSSILLAALVQAVLAGMGFYVAGLGKVFLLTLLTFFGALVPIAGAAIVWGAASLYLLFFEKNTWAAAGLALWGMGVVSTVDNIIKPIVLHGQSKLHPLLALLSVLGGVGALGPIGIFVGPIAVAFLQAALTMLRVEIGSLSGDVAGENSRAVASRRNGPPAGLA
ncbi:MAG: AI-2E family transporter [Planctomycetota bacterium]|nr:MAG: AI-2E family transporter [Planctomycetota bacterium]